MRGLLVVCALALAAAALAAGGSHGTNACHPEEPGSPTEWIHHANLDRDVAMERVVQTIRGCPHQHTLRLEDRCLEQTHRYRLPGNGYVERLDVVEANGKPDGFELLFALRPGKPLGRYRGNVSLVRLEPAGAGRCPTPRDLLSHRLRPKPRGAPGLTHVEVLRSSLHELRITESFDLWWRETRFRYAPHRGRYVRYRVTVKQA